MTWAWWRDRESPEMKEARQMQEKLLDETATNSMTEEQQVHAWTELKAKSKALSNEEQTQLWQQYKGRAMKEKREHLDRFFSLKTKEQRDAFLDADIDRERAYGKKKRSNQTAKRKTAATNQLKKSSSPSTEQQREKLSQYLNSTTADQRGQTWAYWEAMKERRKERGLPNK